MNSEFICLEHLNRFYDEAGSKHMVLQDVSVKIAKGESVALLGRSGSGKSTLLNLISGIDMPDAGSVKVDGLDLTALNEHKRTLFRREHIGFIYQFFNLVPSLTAQENIEFTLELNGVEQNEILTRVTALMEELEITDKAERYPAQLSGGEQQRVAIARALIHQPKIVLADEPTGNLDARTGQSILQIMHRLLKEHNSTLLLVTHSLEVANSADRTITLEDGYLQERDSGFAW
ncbi:MAG: ABC transporter ATP-binding protein [Gammaproteobacteria bacterium]|jgi:putative ABC transport system ATP-binding protein|nr:ABC transporter ATP-binding protein [Gammaproteobacteria bacterium]